MSENVDDEFARRLNEVAAGVAGLSEDEAVEALDVRLQQVQRLGVALHRLSLARARGSLAAALGAGADDEVITSLRGMVATIEEAAPPTSVDLGPVHRIGDPSAPEYDPELAGTLETLVERHRENAVGILGVIAQLSVSGKDPRLIAALEELLAHDLEAMTELERR